MAQENRKPFYKRWWVWLLAAIIIFAATSGESDTADSPEDNGKPIAERQGENNPNAEKDGKMQEESGGEDAAEPPVEQTSETIFTMSSNDTVGATTHTVVGGDHEPSGTYTVRATGGHGAITVNESDLTVLSADEYEGGEYSGLTYVRSVKMELKGSDVIKARNFNSSDFKIEFVLE